MVYAMYKLQNNGMSSTAQFFKRRKICFMINPNLLIVVLQQYNNFSFEKLHTFTFWNGLKFPDFSYFL